jgi:hypothetical protein
MSKVSTVTRHAREMLIAMALIAGFVLIGGCGGGSSTASVPPPGGGSPPTTPTTVQGVATPTSVAVVTATNAQ